MANQSILAAFERMWQHIVYALGEKSDKSHTHSDYMTTASPTGTGALSINRRSNTTVGDNSSAVGFNVAATATASHAEGSTTTASGGSAHAEGSVTTASGSYAHSEGQGTTASSESSHAEGNYTTASGYASHAEGDYTTAASDYQHVQGKNNIVDANGTYAHIVGNGESDTSPSNAHTLDWDGNAWFAGDVYVGGTGQSDGTVLMAKSVYDTDGDGVVDNAAKLAGHGADYFSSWRDCSNVPFNEIAKEKGAFKVNWDSVNSPNANVLFGVSDGWTAIAVSYTGDIYITTIEKTAWEHVSAPASFMPKVQYVTQAGTDLNDYKQDGFYYFDADYTPANIPAGVNGWLEVYSSNVGAVKQKWFRHGTADSNDHNTYIRTFTSGSWSGWAFVMTAKGGTFAGDVKAYETARTTRGLFNNETRAGSTTGTLQSVKYFIDVT